MQPYLYNKKWECRVAAGETIGHIAEHFAHHSASDIKAKFQVLRDARQAAPTFRLHHFHIDGILESGAPLLSSGGQVSGSHSDHTTVRIPLFASVKST